MPPTGIWPSGIHSLVNSDKLSQSFMGRGRPLPTMSQVSQGSRVLTETFPSESVPQLMLASVGAWTARLPVFDCPAASTSWTS